MSASMRWLLTACFVVATSGARSQSASDFEPSRLIKEANTFVEDTAPVGFEVTYTHCGVKKEDDVVARGSLWRLHDGVLQWSLTPNGKSEEGSTGKSVAPRALNYFRRGDVVAIQGSTQKWIGVKIDDCNSVAKEPGGDPRATPKLKRALLDCFGSSDDAPNIRAQLVHWTVFMGDPGGFFDHKPLDVIGTAFPPDRKTGAFDSIAPKFPTAKLGEICGSAKVEEASLVMHTSKRKVDMVTLAVHQTGVPATSKQDPEYWNVTALFKVTSGAQSSDAPPEVMKVLKGPK